MTAKSEIWGGRKYHNTYLVERKLEPYAKLGQIDKVNEIVDSARNELIRMKGLVVPGLIEELEDARRDYVEMARLYREKDSIE